MNLTMHDVVRVLLLVIAITLAGPALSNTGPSASALQIEPIEDAPADDAPGLGSIIGSPDAGPDPDDAGDRGGWAQLVLAVVLVGGVGFIMTRIIRAARQTG